MPIWHPDGAGVDNAPTVREPVEGHMAVPNDHYLLAETGEGVSIVLDPAVYQGGCAGPQGLDRDRRARLLRGTGAVRTQANAGEDGII